MPNRFPVRGPFAALARLISGASDRPARQDRAAALARLKLTSLQAMNA